MATYADRVQKSVTLYEPGPLPEDTDDLGLYLVTELKRLGSILYNQATFRLERIHAEPQPETDEGAWGRPPSFDYQRGDWDCAGQRHRLAVVPLLRPV